MHLVACPTNARQFSKRAYCEAASADCRKYPQQDFKRYSVLCCSNNDLKHFQKTHKCPNLYAGFDMKNKQTCKDVDDMSWNEGNKMCLGIGARLCTAKEIENDCLLNIHCDFNGHLMWTSDEFDATKLSPIVSDDALRPGNFFVCFAFTLFFFQLFFFFINESHQSFSNLNAQNLSYDFV